jgi:hypothetical protein
MVTSLTAFAGPAMADDRDNGDFFFGDGFNNNGLDDGFFFVDGFNPFFSPFDGGVAFDINQEIENTGDVTLNTTVS